MSIRYLPMQWAAQDFIPQAILAISQAEAHERFQLVPSSDDFDNFVGNTMMVDETMVALKRYAGHPPDTLTLYMPPSLDSIEQISRKVFQIVRDLGLPQEMIIWERSQSPDL